MALISLILISSSKYIYYTFRANDTKIPPGLKLVQMKGIYPEFEQNILLFTRHSRSHEIKINCIKPNKVCCTRSFNANLTDDQKMLYSSLSVISYNRVICTDNSVVPLKMIDGIFDKT